MATPGGRHERVYRRLLRLYPSAFRTRYGDEMVQLFGDQLHASRAGGEPIGTASLWFRTLWDLVATAASEHGRERSVAHSLSVPPTPTTRALGLLGILGGAILLVAFLPSMDIERGWNFVRLALYCLGALAIIVAVHRRQVAVSPLLAWTGAIPAFATTGAYLVMLALTGWRERPFEGDFGVVWSVVSFTMWLADGWFGVVTFKLGVVTRWGALALMLGSFAVIGIDRVGLVTSLEPTIFSVLALGGVALNGIGWVLLGWDVATRRRPSEIHQP